ncbi:MAG: ATP-binding protein [Acidobacteria bacterium]|nr:ATP-binding protein [Acidobacteriota bacterium]
MAQQNPFVYGEIVTSGAFADREAERERLASDLGEGQKVFLISPRRYGKSSLVRDVLRGLARQRVLTVEVTVAASSSYVGFLEAYARALVTADTPVARLRRWTTELLDAVRPELRMETPAAGHGASGPGRVTLAFPAIRTARDTARLAAEVFALPGRIATARGQRLAIALDEFQAIAAFDEGNVEHALRAAVQDQRSVGYVFAGSEPSLMERMLEARRPFYKAGPVIRLGKIDEDVFAAFIDERFRSSGVKPEPGLGEAIVDLAGNVPYDVQRLAHETWDDVRVAGLKSAGLDDLHATLTRLLGEHQTAFEEAWQRRTLSQRAVLRALVLEDGRELLSADVRSRHRLPGASSVQSSLAALVKQDIVMKEDGRYLVSDSLYREWVARKTF